MQPMSRYIIEAFRDFILSNGKVFGEYYIGTSGHPVRTLFEKHRVNQHEDRWICFCAYNVDIASEIKEHMIEIQGATGTDEKAGADEVYIYAYRMETYTIP